MTEEQSQREGPSFSAIKQRPHLFHASVELDVHVLLELHDELDGVQVEDEEDGVHVLLDCLRDELGVH